MLALGCCAAEGWAVAKAAAAIEANDRKNESVCERKRIRNLRWVGSPSGGASKIIWRRGTHNLGGGSIAFVRFPSQAVDEGFSQRRMPRRLVGDHVEPARDFQVDDLAVNGEAVALE